MSIPRKSGVRFSVRECDRENERSQEKWSPGFPSGNATAGKKGVRSAIQSRQLDLHRAAGWDRFGSEALNLEAAPRD
jgi:hypothetical protein